MEVICKMKILVTGGTGFIGKNLCARLRAIQDGKDRSHPDLIIDKIYEWNRNTSEEEKVQDCQKANFVFHLAGVNRPESPEEFTTGNYYYTKELLFMLQEAGNNCPVMLASSVQASLSGRYENSFYGKSKLESEYLLNQHCSKTGAKAMIYRFPNVFGKWCRPNYNSVVATFCFNMARDLPIQIDDPNTQLELLYIDDLVEEMLFALEGKEHRCKYQGITPILDPNGSFCYVPITHKVSLGQLVNEINNFHLQPQTLIIPQQGRNTFRKKLYATYLSYLPQNNISIPLKMNIDDRGSFTELFKTENCGQVSVNISKPGITKGQHWHNTKWEFFIVVSGHGLIQERKIGSDEILEFEVFGDTPEAVHMLPGYTHNIINLSTTEDLVTIMWANELYNPSCPDTYHEEV